MAIQVIGMSQNVLAGGTFNFTGYSTIGTDTVLTDIVRGPVYAILELSGESPYDHTDIMSLTFTLEGGDLLGYVGEYAGTFDSSSGTIEEDSSGQLLSSGLDSGSLNLSSYRTEFFDFDAPPPNLADSSLGLNSSLEITFHRGSSFYLSQSRTTTLGNSTFQVPVDWAFLSGSWVSAVPEPTSLALVIYSVLLTYCRRVRS